jgi:hypothetical protein
MRKKAKIHKGKQEACPQCAPKLLGLDEAFRLAFAKQGK